MCSLLNIFGKNMCLLLKTCIQNVYKYIACYNYCNAAHCHKIIIYGYIKMNTWLRASVHFCQPSKNSTKRLFILLYWTKNNYIKTLSLSLFSLIKKITKNNSSTAVYSICAHKYSAKGQHWHETVEIITLWGHIRLYSTWILWGITK